MSSLREALDWTTPAVATTVSGEAAGGEHAHHGAEPVSEGPAGEAGAVTDDHAHHDSGAGSAGEGEPGVGFDAALAVARADHEITGPVEIRPPSGADGVYVVEEIDKSWPTSVDTVALAPDTGDLVDEVRFADYSVAAKLARWGVDIHMGLLFGLGNQIALVLLAAALIAMTLIE